MPIIKNYFLILPIIYCLGRIKLKLVDDDKFLGAVKNKLQLVDYKEALSIKLNPMKDISEKNLESKDGTALTETGFWFFPKSYSMKSNSMSGKQAFRIVYYAPNEYLLMRGDSCLGFKGGKFKKVSCKLDEASRFRICYNRVCDSYLDIKSDLECIKMYLGMNIGGNRGLGNGRRGDGRTGGGRRGDNDSSSDSHESKKKKKPKEEESDSDPIANCGDYLGNDGSNRKRGRRSPYHNRRGDDQDYGPGYGYGYPIGGPGYGYGYPMGGPGYGPGYGYGPGFGYGPGYGYPGGGNNNSSGGNNTTGSNNNTTDNNNAIGSNNNTTGSNGPGNGQKSDGNTFSPWNSEMKNCKNNFAKLKPENLDIAATILSVLEGNHLFDNNAALSGNTSTNIC